VIRAVPGSSRSEIYLQADHNGPFALIATFRTATVTFRHHSHGTYRVLSYGPAGNLVDSRSQGPC
jgi:hypothetical protein